MADHQVEHGGWTRWAIGDKWDDFGPIIRQGSSDPIGLFWSPRRSSKAILARRQACLLGRTFIFLINGLAVFWGPQPTKRLG